MSELSGHTEEQDGASADTRDELAGCRILVVMPTIPLYGMERKTLNIMRGLRERGADVLFITQKDYGQNIQREVEEIGCRWVTASFDKLLHLSRRPRVMAQLLRTWIRSALELYRIRNAYKPTHIHIPNITLFLYSWPVLLFAREPVVFALPNPPDTDFTGLKRHLNRFIWRYGVGRNCDYIICNSEFTLSQVKAVGANIGKTSVIYPLAGARGKGSAKTGKLTLIYNSAPERTNRVGDSPSIDKSKLNVVYVGRVCADKGVREFVDVAKQVASERGDVDFHLVGDYKWRNSFAEEIIGEVKAKGFAGRINFHGVINDVPDFLSQCDLHVCPSVWEEPFGIVVLEAKSQSIPSVVFPSGGLKEIVNHLVDGYVCPEKTSAALYEGVTYFLNRPEVMRTAGRAANLSMVRFSNKKIIDSWTALYKQTELAQP